MTIGAGSLQISVFPVNPKSKSFNSSGVLPRSLFKFHAFSQNYFSRKITVSPLYDSYGIRANKNSAIKYNLTGRLDYKTCQVTSKSIFIELFLT